MTKFFKLSHIFLYFFEMTVFFPDFKSIISFVFIIMYLVPKIFLWGFLCPCKIDKILRFSYWYGCPRYMIFAQAIVFHPYFMGITASISIWLQLSNNINSKLLKNFSKSNFLGYSKLSLEIFQNIFEFWFLVNLHHSFEYYEAWKDEDFIWSKTWIWLSKN